MVHLENRQESVEIGRLKIESSGLKWDARGIRIVCIQLLTGHISLLHWILRIGDWCWLNLKPILYNTEQQVHPTTSLFRECCCFTFIFSLLTCFLSPAFVGIWKKQVFVHHSVRVEDREYLVVCVRECDGCVSASIKINDTEIMNNVFLYPRPN